MTPEQFTDLAEKIATLLHMTLRRDGEELASDVFRHLVTPDGYGVLLNTTWARGRLVITGWLPAPWARFKPYNVQYKTITVAPTRSAEDIAREIERRLLSDVAKAASAALAAFNVHEEVVAQVSADVERFLRLGFSRMEHLGADGERATLRSKGDANHELVVNYDRTVNATFRDVPVDRAVELCRLVRELEAAAMEAAGQGTV